MRRSGRLGFALTVIWCVLAGRAVSADEVTIRATRDTTLYEDNPGFSNGAGQYLFVGYNGGRFRRRALIHFDIAGSVPAGATVTGASMTLHLSRGQARQTRIGLHRLLAIWSQSTSRASGEEGGGAPAAEGDATWSHRVWQTERWEAPGGDFTPAASATAEVSDLGTYTWMGEALVADVQSCLDVPSDNFGWIVVGDAGAGGAAKRFDSHSHPGGEGPRLTVTFEPPTAMTGACCLPDGSCGMRLHEGASCGDGATYQGAGSSCGTARCPEPVGACCLLDAAATCEPKTRQQCAAGAWQGGNRVCEPNPCPVGLEPYVDALPIPAIATPTRGEQGAAAEYKIRMVQRKQKLHRDLPETTVWAYDDGTNVSYPGPTIVARRDEPVDVTWVNDLRDERGEPLAAHALSVDNCLHGAALSQPRTVVHLHGGHVPADFDGQPELTLLPGEDVHYTYPNKQRAATLWYHDHAIGITRLNVIMGLAGFYLLRDAEEDALELPSGEYEIGLALQDRDFNPDGSFRYPSTWQESFFGHTPVVNGMVAPYLEVDRGAYRFHLLNGSSSRVYTLSLSSGRPFVQTGTDGGLRREAISLKEITIAPGERADVVVDFSYAGAEEILQNSARSPYPNGGGGVELPALMKFKVTDHVGHQKVIPTRLSKTLEQMTDRDAVMTRDLVLMRTQQDECGYGMWTINGKDWHEITEEPHLGTREVWRFVNRSGVMHPMHMHLLFFQVLDRQKHRMEGDMLVPVGDPEPPARTELGWKDTVQVGPYEAVRVIASFEDYEGTYPYHCHLLEHEDHGMMRQFHAKAVCGDGALAQGFEECDDGNVREGDGCSSSCTVESEGPSRGAQPQASPGMDHTPDAGERSAESKLDADDLVSSTSSVSHNPDAPQPDYSACSVAFGARHARADGVWGVLPLLSSLFWFVRRTRVRKSHR